MPAVIDEIGIGNVPANSDRVYREGVGEIGRSYTEWIVRCGDVRGKRGGTTLCLLASIKASVTLSAEGRIDT